MTTATTALQYPQSFLLRFCSPSVMLLGSDAEAANKTVQCRVLPYTQGHRADAAWPSFWLSGEMPMSIIYSSLMAVGEWGTFHQDEFLLHLVFVPNPENKFLSSSAIAGSGFRWKTPRRTVIGGTQTFAFQREYLQSADICPRYPSLPLED